MCMMQGPRVSSFYMFLYSIKDSRQDVQQQANDQSDVYPMYVSFVYPMYASFVYQMYVSFVYQMYMYVSDVCILCISDVCIRCISDVCIRCIDDVYPMYRRSPTLTSAQRLTSPAVIADFVFIVVFVIVIIFSHFNLLLQSLRTKTYPSVNTMFVLFSHVFLCFFSFCTSGIFLFFFSFVQLTFLLRWTNLQMERNR